MLNELVIRMEARGYPNQRPAYSRVFENLDPGGTRLADLAERAQMTHQSMSELVAVLEKQGVLERQPDPTDKRAKLICFTPAGREMIKISLAEIQQIEQEWLERLGPAFKESLQSALTEVNLSKKS
jgi:DNA-binding MarR family transcriptional regulator